MDDVVDPAKAGTIIPGKSHRMVCLSYISSLQHTAENIKYSTKRLTVSLVSLHQKYFTFMGPCQTVHIEFSCLKQEHKK